MSAGPMERRVRVLIVDDSALVRSVLTQGLASDPQLEVVGAASNPYTARDLLVRLRPDVMTLDLEMPQMDGLSFLRKIMAKLPTPTVILSSLAQQGSSVVVQALEAGALDVVAKPTVGIAKGLDAMMQTLIERIKVAAHSKLEVRPVVPQVSKLQVPNARSFETTDTVIGLGASMGGVAALNRILPTFPPWSPGVVIVQHMPADFTAQFATRLDEVCAMRVSEARHGERVLPGHILVAPGGDRHLEIRRFGGEYRVHLQPGPPVSGHTPSVDVFFNSLARAAGPRAAACLLTGMGRDGAEGLLALRLAGGRTFAQDQATAAVWGMPRAAVELGAAEHCVALEQVPQTLVRAARPSVPPRASSLPPRASTSTPPRASTSTPPRASSLPPRASTSTPPRASRSTPPRA